MYDTDSATHLCSEPELFVLVSVLGANRRGLTSLQLARDSGLSTLVVVPALAELIRRRLVLRSDFADHGARDCDWTYRLAAQGRRVLTTWADR